MYIGGFKKPEHLRACRRDGSTLQKVPFAGNVVIDECPTCRIVVLDRGELQAIIATVSANGLTMQPVAQHQTFEEQRYCLDCNNPMAKQNDRGVIIDVCQRDGQTILDPGELQTIVSRVTSMTGFNVGRIQQHGYGHYGHHSSSDGHGHGRHHRSSGGFLGMFFSS